MKTINIIAPTIKTGGGKELLLYLTEYLQTNFPDVETTVYINKGLTIKESSNFNVVVIDSKIKLIRLYGRKFTNVLYFGNLPPFFRVNNSAVYFQNRYLLFTISELFSLKYSTLVNKFKNAFRQVYIKFFIKNVDFVACQNTTTQKKFISKYNYHRVEILPFFRSCPKIDQEIEKKFDLCYVSLAHPHKNHTRLLDALEILIEKAIYLNIALTVENENMDLINRINKINIRGVVNIYNFGVISKEDVCAVYEQSKCLIFPSTSESFGLPLIEAVELGLDVIASDLDFTFEVVEPSSVFNPYSSMDIADKIEQYLLGNTKKSFYKVDNMIRILIDRMLKNPYES